MNEFANEINLEEEEIVENEAFEEAVVEDEIPEISDEEPVEGEILDDEDEEESSHSGLIGIASFGAGFVAGSACTVLGINKLKKNKETVNKRGGPKKWIEDGKQKRLDAKNMKAYLKAHPELQNLANRAAEADEAKPESQEEAKKNPKK